jgi:hypothetical protein
MPRDATTMADYIVSALKKFLRWCCEWVFHRYHTSLSWSHSPKSAGVPGYKEHPFPLTLPNSPSADFFQCPTLKRELVSPDFVLGGWRLGGRGYQDSCKKSLHSGFPEAAEHAKTCVKITSGYLEKSWQITVSFCHNTYWISTIVKLSNAVLRSRSRKELKLLAGAGSGAGVCKFWLRIPAPALGRTKVVFFLYHNSSWTGSSKWPKSVLFWKRHET